MPAEASPLCSIPFANANPACWAEGAIGNAIEGIAGGAVRELAQAVVGSVQELFGAILDFLATPVRPDLQAEWFAANVDRMIAVSATFALLFFLFGLGQAIVRSSMRELGRVVGFTVLAFAVSGVALALAQGFIAAGRCRHRADRRRCAERPGRDVQRPHAPAHHDGGRPDRAGVPRDPARHPHRARRARRLPRAVRAQRDDPRRRLLPAAHAGRHHLGTDPPVGQARHRVPRRAHPEQVRRVRGHRARLVRRRLVQRPAAEHRVGHRPRRARPACSSPRGCRGCCSSCCRSWSCRCTRP